MRFVVRLLVGIVAVCLLSPAAAHADDCAALGGSLVAGECQVSTVQVVPNTTYTISGPLRITTGGALVVPQPVPAIAPNTFQLTVHGGLIIEVGGKIDGSVINPADVGARLDITADGNIRLVGNGNTGGRIVSNAPPTSCSVNGKAGDITLTSKRGGVTIDAGAIVESSAQCPTGEIIVGSDGDIQIDGAIRSAGGGSSSLSRGGPITINSGGRLTISQTGQVVSDGANPGADRVHLESALDMTIDGLVKSGAGVVHSASNKCDISTRPDKFALSTGCVEVWSGGRLTIDNTGGNGGFVLGQAGHQGGQLGVCCAWIDLLANGDITITGPPEDPLGILTPVFVVDATQFANDTTGGAITVKSFKGKVTANAAISTDASNVSNGVGGTVVIEAGGPNASPIQVPFANQTPNPASNVDLGYSVVLAAGVTGGAIHVRSFNGLVTGGGTAGTFDGVYEHGALDASGGGTVALTLSVCGVPEYQGVILPFTPVPTQVCGGSPTAASYVAFPLPKPTVTVTVTGSPFPYDGNYHPVTSASAVGLLNESLPVVVTYTDSNGNTMSSAPPQNPGVYVATATFPGSAQYRAASAIATLIIEGTAAQPVMLTITGFDPPGSTVSVPPSAFSGPYTASARTVVVTSTPAVGPVNCTYNGVAAPPVDAGTYQVQCAFQGDGVTYQSAQTVATLTITKVNPTVTARPETHVYDGNPHRGLWSITGVGGAPLVPDNAIVPGVLSVTYSTPAQGGIAAGSPPQEIVGTFNFTVTYIGNGNYNAGVSATSTITISPATPAVAVNGATCTFTGAPCPATGTALGVSGVPLSFLLTLTYMNANGQPVSAPTAIGVYTVTATFNGPGPSHDPRYVTVTGLGAIVTIRGTAVPTIVFTGAGQVVFDGTPHAVTAVARGTANELLSEPVAITYLYPGGTPPIQVGTYAVFGSYPGNLFYVPTTATATLTIIPPPPGPTEPCVTVDFREVTYFRENRVIMSSDPQIRLHNGIGAFDPSVWPFAPRGGRNATASRGTLFRIYGFAAAQLGQPIPNADHPSVTYPVLADPDIPNAYYIDLVGPARAGICVSQLQKNLIDASSPARPWVLPGTRKLSDQERNVPGIMLNHNASQISIPRRVRDELKSLGMPLVDAAGRDAREGMVDYVGFQLWGHGDSRYREFVDVEIRVVTDDPHDRPTHYTFGFHTAKNQSFEGFVGCNYLDYSPGDDAVRMNDGWKGAHVGQRGWGAACGHFEPGRNQKMREDYEVSLDGIQMLPTVSSGDDTLRIYLGKIRPPVRAGDRNDDDDNDDRD